MLPKDFRGAPLHVGDRVAYNSTQQGTFLRVAIVQGYTPERLLIPWVPKHGPVIQRLGFRVFIAATGVQIPPGLPLLRYASIYHTKDTG